MTIEDDISTDRPGSPPPDELLSPVPPAPPPIPREFQSEKSLLLDLHQRLDALAPALAELGRALREFAKVPDQLRENDRAWFLVMNFLEEEAMTRGNEARALKIHDAAEARARALGENGTGRG